MRVEHLGFTTKRKFGVELEIDPSTSKEQLNQLLCNYESAFSPAKEVYAEYGEGSEAWSESNGNHFWHIKYDSSCGPTGNKKLDGGGWEVASYVASGREEIKAVAQAAGYLGDHSVTTNPFCGLHIHVDASDFTSEQVGVLLAFWLKIETLVMQSLPPHRKRNKYCKLLRRRLKLHQPGSDLWECLRPKDLSVHENPEKKYTINTVGWVRGDRSTIEFRWPECVLEEQHVFFWTLFFVHFVEQCYRRSPPQDHDPVKTLDDALAVLGLEKKGKLLLLDEDLFCLKTWLLRRILIYGQQRKWVHEAQKKLAFVNDLC